MNRRNHAGSISDSGMSRWKGALIIAILLAGLIAPGVVAWTLALTR